MFWMFFNLITFKIFNFLALIQQNQNSYLELTFYITDRGCIMIGTEASNDLKTVLCNAFYIREVPLRV